MAARLDEVRLDLAGGWVDRTPLLEWAAQVRPRKPVMLVTLQSTPFASAAIRFALEATIESGRPLVAVNIVKLSHPPSCSPSVPEALRGPATLAGLLGCDVDRVRIRTASPSAALLEFAAECRPSVVVFGTSPAAVPERDRKAYDKLTRALCGKVLCLVWHPWWAGEPSREEDGKGRQPGPESRSGRWGP
jgi:hypothetical protein